MRLQNDIMEYVHSKNLEDIKEGIAELAEKESLAKSICIGHFLMWSFSQTEKEVVVVNHLITLLKERNIISLEDLEEG